MHWFDYGMSRCPRHSDYDDHDDSVVYQDGTRWGDFWKGVHLSRVLSFVVFSIVVIIVAVFVVSFAKTHRSARRRFIRYHLFFFIYFIVLYTYDLLAVVILLALLCFVRTSSNKLLCWVEFSDSRLLLSSLEYYTERQHSRGP